jgi:membrane protein DedA with SNARE-associated domain
MLQVQQWIADYGYFGVFFLLMLGVVGAPVPDETVLLLTGYLIFRGKLHPLVTFAAAFLGSASGITVSYLLGKFLGLRIIHRIGQYVGITRERVNRAHARFRKIGHWALFVGYFVPGVRHLTAMAAGVSNLEMASFMTYAYSGAFVWVSTFLSIGYFFGDRWEWLSEIVHRNLMLTCLVIAALLSGYALIRRFVRMRSA